MNVYSITILRRFDVGGVAWGENVNATEWRIADDIESAILQSKDYNVGRTFSIRVSRRDGDRVICTDEKHVCQSVSFTMLKHVCRLSPTPEVNHE